LSLKWACKLFQNYIISYNKYWFIRYFRRFYEFENKHGTHSYSLYRQNKLVKDKEKYHNILFSSYKKIIIDYKYNGKIVFSFPRFQCLNKQYHNHYSIKINYTSHPKFVQWRDDVLKIFTNIPIEKYHIDKYIDNYCTSRYLLEIYPNYVCK
jgi:hypothetical protein